MSTASGGLKCSLKPVGECGNIRAATHGDEIEWCLELVNTSPYTLSVDLQMLEVCMPEIAPGTLTWVSTPTGQVLGNSAGAGDLADSLSFVPTASVVYEIKATVRDDALCPSWVVNSAQLTYEATINDKPEKLCKSICSEPVPVGTDHVDWDIYPCDPKTINIDEHAWQFFGGGDYAEHAKLTQFLAEGVTLAGILQLLKKLAPAAYDECVATRCSSRPEDNIQWPAKEVLSSTAVIGVGPPFEGGPGEQP